VSFKGAEDLANDWVSDPDLEARSFVIDPQSQALIELKGQTVITAIVKETFIDDASGEVIIENSIGFEIKLKGLINSFAGVSKVENASTSAQQAESEVAPDPIRVSVDVVSETGRILIRFSRYFLIDLSLPTTSETVTRRRLQINEPYTKE